MFSGSRLMIFRT